MKQILTNGELITGLVSAITFGILRAVEKHRLRKKKKLFDNEQENITVQDEKGNLVNGKIIGKN